MRGRERRRHLLKAQAGLVDECLRTERQVGGHIRVDDGLHGRPTAIHASTSAAVGRRVCACQPASILQYCPAFGHMAFEQNGAVVTLGERLKRAPGR